MISEQKFINHSNLQLKFFIDCLKLTQEEGLNLRKLINSIVEYKLGFTMKNRVLIKIIQFCFEYHFFLFSITSSLLYLVQEINISINSETRVVSIILIVLILIWSSISLMLIKKKGKKQYILFSQIFITFIFAEYFIESKRPDQSLFFVCQILFQKLCLQQSNQKQTIIVLLSILTLIYIIVRLNLCGEQCNSYGGAQNVEFILIAFFSLIIPLGIDQVMNKVKSQDVPSRKQQIQIQQTSNQEEDIEKQSPMINLKENQQSIVDDKDGKSAKIQYLQKFIEKDINLLHNKYSLKYNINKSSNQQLNQQRYKQQSIADASITSDAQYQMNQNTQASMLLNPLESKKYHKLLNLIEEALDHNSLGIAIFNSKKELVYNNSAVFKDFLSGYNAKSNIKQGIFQYSLDTKNISSMAQKYSNQKDKNRSTFNSKTENQLNKSLSLGATIVGSNQQSSILYSAGMNSNQFDLEDTNFNESREQRKKSSEYDDKSQMRLRVKTELTNEFQEVNITQIL